MSHMGEEAGRKAIAGGGIGFYRIRYSGYGMLVSVNQCGSECNGLTSLLPAPLHSPWKCHLPGPYPKRGPMC